MSELKIDADARARLRAAITGHHGWRAYKEAIGKGIAEFTKDDYLTACAALGLDAATIVNNGEKNEGGVMKERTKDREQVNSLRVRFADAGNRMPYDAAEKCRAIFATIDERQSGMATDAQWNAIERAIERASVTRDTAAAPVTINPIPSGTAAGGDAAGAALADMVAPHIAGRVLSHVMAAVETRLETVSTVRIEIARDGVAIGASEGHHHPLFATLCKALASRQADGYAPNIWIAGPAGSGKTYAAKSFAKAAGLPFHFNGSVSMPHELLGFIDAAGTYHRTPFREAFENGGVYVFDEADGSENAALLAMNPPLANNRATFPDKAIERHKDCVIIATANTWGMGATSDYVGRSKIDAAFLDRFGVRLFWNYDTALEVAISGNPDFARRVQAARERARAAGLKVLISPRATMAGAALIAGGMSPDDAAALTYLANLSDEQKKIVEGR